MKNKKNKPQEKYFLSADLRVKIDDYIDFQELFLKPNPSIKAVEQMKTNYLFKQKQNNPLPLSYFEFNSPELNGESRNIHRK